MNGIVANPMHVGNHLRAIPGSFDRLERIPALHVTRFITNPGIITDASICHTNTSPAALAAVGIFPPPNTSGRYLFGNQMKKQTN